MKIPLAAALLLALAPLAAAGSETPPPGPDWERNLIVAQQKACEQGKPLFLYFTKTY